MNFYCPENSICRHCRQLFEILCHSNNVLSLKIAKIYRETPKNSDVPTNCCNQPKIEQGVFIVE